MASFIASAPELVRALGGRWNGRRGMAKCPAHPDRTPSLSVAESDDARLLFFCHAGCAQEAVLDALRRLGLWPDRGGAAYALPDSAVIEARSRQVAEDRQHRLERARMIWEESTPDHCRDLVRVYWRWRGLTLEPPPTIRSGLIWHPFERRTMPAMIAAIQNTEGRLQGVHVTCLRRDGRGKAQTERPRLIYGQMIGGAVRLAPAGRKLGLAEGIENAATVQQEAGLTCWAALSAGNLPKLELPATISEVVLCPDRGQAGESAAQAAADGYLAKGHEVRVAWPPGNFEDFNAALMAEACGEAA